MIIFIEDTRKNLTDNKKFYRETSSSNISKHSRRINNEKLSPFSFFGNKKNKIETYSQKMFTEIGEELPEKITITNKGFVNRLNNVKQFSIKTKLQPIVEQKRLRIFLQFEIPELHNNIRAEFILTEGDRGSEFKFSGMIGYNSAKLNNKIIENTSTKDVVKEIVDLINKNVALEVTKLVNHHQPKCV